MADMDRIGDVELLHQLRQIVRIGIHVIALPGLARPPVAAAVTPDDAIAVRRQEEHLVFERVGRERPAVAEHHRLPASPVLVLDAGSVLCRDRACHLDPARPG
jgi:hypothetical protein